MAAARSEASPGDEAAPPAAAAPPPALGTAAATWPTYLAPKAKPPGAAGALPENLRTAQGAGRAQESPGAFT
jgi:hypothetical protein